MIEQRANPIKETACDIADRLEEKDHGARALIYRIVKGAGTDAAMSFLQKTLEVEANGGMMLPDGSRRRTVGGVFFQIVKSTLPGKQRFFIWGGSSAKGKNDCNRKISSSISDKSLEKSTPQPATIFTWEDRITAIDEAESEKGQISTVKITIVGRPGKVVERPGCIVTVMEESKVPALPKRLPTPTSTPTKYAVYIASKQWAKVKEAILDPEDALIIEGFPKTDGQASAIAVFATNITTKKLQAAQRAEKKDRKSTRLNSS